MIFENIRKVVGYTLSSSFAEVLVFGACSWMACPAAGGPDPVDPLPICDGPSDIVLGFEPRERGIMEEPPQAVSGPILNRLGLSLIGIISSASAAVGLLLFRLPV